MIGEGIFFFGYINSPSYLHFTKVMCKYKYFSRIVEPCYPGHEQLFLKSLAQGKVK
jgi:hypothetical protein